MLVFQLLQYIYNVYNVFYSILIFVNLIMLKNSGLNSKMIKCFF